MKALFIMCLLFASTLASAAPARTPCGKFSSTDSVSRPLKIEEIERHEMEMVAAMLKVADDLPKVPFAYRHDAWLSFKSKLRPGDKIVAYSTDKRSWQHRAGEAGYATMRSGCVIERFVTTMN